MARKLSSWERSQRQRDRERERERAAASRARERERAARDRAYERSRIRAERAAEREDRRRERERDAQRKVRAKQDQIAAWRDEVEEAAAYLDGLGRLHAGLPSLAGASRRFEQLLQERPYPPNQFVPTTFAEKLVPKGYTAPPFEPQPAPLWPAFALGFLALLVAVGAALWHVVAGFFTLTVGVAGALALGLVLAAAHRKKEAARLLEFEAEIRAEQARVEAENRLAAQSWEARRNRYDAIERARRAYFDAREARNAELFEDREEERLDVLADAKEGSPTALELVLEALLPIALEIEAPPDEYAEAPFAPDEVEAAYAVDAGGVARVAVMASGLEVVPTRESEMTPSGERIKYKTLPEKRRVQVWREHVESLALAHAAAIFGAAPAIDAIELELWSEAVDPGTGATTPCCLLGARVTRGALAEVDLAAAVASAVWTRIGCRRGERVAAGKNHLERRLPEDELTWAQPDAEQPYLPRGLVQGQPSPALPNEFARRDTAWDRPDQARAEGSIAAALAKVRPGGEVVVPPGRYTERLGVKWPVTLRAEQAGKAELVAADGDAIDCRTVGLVVEGLVLRSTSEAGDAVYVCRGGAELRGCTLTGTANGVNLAEAWVTITGGRLSGSGRHGVVVGRRSQAWLGAAEVTGNARAGVFVRERGSADIRDSRVHQNGYEGVWAQAGARVALATTDLRGNKRGAIDVEDGAELQRGEGVYA